MTSAASLPCFDLPAAGTRGDDDGFGCLSTARGALPLVAFAADLAVTGMHYAWRLRQTFVNADREAIEAVYIFPLPPRAAVAKFRMLVGGRVIEGRLRERGAARAEYQVAVQQGQRAALLEEDRPNVFTVQIGNLQAGERAEVELELSGPVAVEDGHAAVRLPLVVAPRYIPGQALGDDVGSGTAADTTAVPDASRISPPVLLPGFPNPVRLELTIALDGAGAPVEELACSLPTTAHGPGRWRVAPGQRLDRDLILRWRAASTTLVGTALAVTAPGGGEVIAVSVAPPRAAPGQRPRDVVILLDRSGSMGGWKMIAARRAAARLVDTLDAADRVAVLAFDDGIIAPPGHAEALVAATDRARFAAIGFLAGVEAAGGTEIDPALASAFALLDGAGSGAERERVLVLITDGQVGNEDQLLAKHAASLARTKVIALGIDQAVNEALMERLAQPGRGWCACVESEDWLDQILAIAARHVQAPALTDLAVEVAGLEAGSLTPEPLPDAYPTRPLTLWLRAAGAPATLVLRGTLPDGTIWRQELPVQRRDAPAVAQCWARARIRDLEDRHAAQRGGEELPARIIALSLEQQVLSRFTAFVAVDTALTGQGPGRTVVQAVDLAAGWEELDAAKNSLGGAHANIAAFALGSPAPAPAQSMAAPGGAPSRGAAYGGGSMRKKKAAPPASGARLSRRLAAPAQADAASDPLADVAGPPTPADLAAQARALLARFLAAAADPVRLALALRKGEHLALLRTLAAALRTLGGTPQVTAAAELGAFAQALDTLLARLATATTMPAVAALWPELERTLTAVATLAEGATTGDSGAAGGPQGGGAARPIRRFWW